MNCSEQHRNKLKEGVKCCLRIVRNCNSCPYFNDCDQLREDILKMIQREEIDATDWSGFQGGDSNGSKEHNSTIKEPQRGQRAKCNFYEDGWVDPEIVKEVCQPFTMKIAEFNKPNKNKRIIKIPSMSKEDREIMNDIGYVPPTYSHYDDGEEE